MKTDLSHVLKPPWSCQSQDPRENVAAARRELPEDAIAELDSIGV